MTRNALYKYGYVIIIIQPGTRVVLGPPTPIYSVAHPIRTPGGVLLRVLLPSKVKKQLVARNSSWHHTSITWFQGSIRSACVE